MYQGLFQMGLAPELDPPKNFIVTQELDTVILESYRYPGLRDV